MAWPRRRVARISPRRAERGAPTTVIQLDRHRRRDEVTAGEDEASPSVIRILLIDDDDDDVLILRDLLARSERLSFVIEHAADLEQGLAGLLAAAHDIALIAKRLAGTDVLASARLATPRVVLGMPVILLARRRVAGAGRRGRSGGCGGCARNGGAGCRAPRAGDPDRAGAPPPHGPAGGPAARDALTGLPGPPLFRDRLELALARARRQNTLAAIVASISTASSW